MTNAAKHVGTYGLICGLALAMALGLGSCGNKKEAETAPATEEAAEAAEEAAEEAEDQAEDAEEGLDQEEDACMGNVDFKD